MKKSRNIIIGALLIAVVSMAIGYAALAQQLSIKGTANIAADWDIEITKIAMTSQKGAKNHEDKAPTFTATSATFNVDLEYPGAYAEFDVDIENLGTIDAYLVSVAGVDTANAAEPDVLKYTLTGVSANDNLLQDGKATAHVKVEWVASADDTDVIPEVTTKTATITFNYKQKTA